VKYLLFEVSINNVIKKWLRIRRNTSDSNTEKRH
jgi:hypothetical protein